MGRLGFGVDWSSCTSTSGSTLPCSWSVKYLILDPYNNINGMGNGMDNGMGNGMINGMLNGMLNGIIKTVSSTDL